jgi:hypothetical protein
MRAPCLRCGSAGHVDRGTSPAWTLCRLCGRAWIPSLGKAHPTYPELAWWVEWDRDRFGPGLGGWGLYESDVAASFSAEIAASRSRATLLDVLQALLDLIGKRTGSRTARQKEAAG